MITVQRVDVTLTAIDGATFSAKLWTRPDVSSTNLVKRARHLGFWSDKRIAAVSITK